MPSKDILDFFWKLASDNENDRVEAAVGLLDTLINAESEDDWAYAFKRLVKGLASPRGSSRIGFSMALTELLNVRGAEKISISQYLEALEESTKLSGKLKGHEERALYFGRLFGIQSLANSNLTTSDKTTLEDFENIVNVTLDLANSKAWLSESCFFSLCLLVEKLKDTKVDTEKALEYILKKVNELKFTTTSEGVALYLTIPENLRHKYGKLENGWANGDPLAKGNTVLLSKALKEIDTTQPESDEKTKQKGNWKAKLHFVWAKLALFFRDQVDTNTSKSKKIKKTSSKETEFAYVGLDEFWKAVIDEGFFSSSASNERKYWGFEVFSLFLQVLDTPEQIKILFSPNFLRSLLNQLSQKDRYLHKVANKTANTIVELGTAKPYFISTILSSLLLSKQGSITFDQITKTKTTQRLFSAIKQEQVPEVSRILLDILLKPGETEQKPVESRRQWALDLLLQLVKSHAVTSNGLVDWIDEILPVLTREGFFKPSSSKKRKHEDNVVDPPFSDKTVEQCRQRLISVITATIGAKRSDSSSWSNRALSHILKFEEDLELRNAFEGELLEAKNKAVKTLNKIRKKRLSSPHADTPQLEAFELLFSLVLLQVYSMDPEAASVLDELQVCYKTILGKSSIEEGGDEAIDATQILTEIILSFVSRQSSLLRKISETVWNNFSGKITKESLMLLFDVLVTKESKEGHEEMFENSDDNEDDDEEDDAEENDENNEDEDENEDEDMSAEEEGGDDLDRTALANALGINELASDDDDEESMDDEQMLALDDQLSAIFKQRRRLLTESSGRKPDQKNLVHFKSRVLDLLEQFIKSQPTSPLIVTYVLPLLSLLEITDNKGLADRAYNILKTKVCKAKATEVESPEEVFEYLEEVHKIARSSPRNTLSQACNQASVYLSKTLILQDKSYVNKVVDLYSDDMKEFLLKGSKIQPAMFFDFVNWAQSVKGAKFQKEEK